MYWPSLQLICHCLVYNLFGFDFNLRSIEYSILPSSNKTGFFPPLQCMFKPTPAWLHPSYIYKGINGYCILFLPYCHAYGFSLFSLSENNALWPCNLIILHRVSLTGFHTVSGHNPYMYRPSINCLVIIGFTIYLVSFSIYAQ